MRPKFIVIPITEIAPSANGSQERFSIIPIAEIVSSANRSQERPFVLVVNGDSAVADTLVAVLSLHGYAAVAAYDATSALDIAEQIPPELLLADVVMPNMNGVELGIALRKKKPACKVMLFSGQATSDEKILEEEAATYRFPVLAKPIHPEILLDRIAICLHGKEQVATTERDPFHGGEDARKAVFMRSAESDS